MNDDEDRPSFPARLVIVSCYCVIVFQLFWAWNFDRFHDRIRYKQDAWFLVGWTPCGAYVLLAVLYYLMKGMPVGADKKAIVTPLQICAVSALGGLFFCEVWYS